MLYLWPWCELPIFCAYIETFKLKQSLQDCLILPLQNNFMVSRFGQLSSLSMLTLILKIPLIIQYKDYSDFWGMTFLYAILKLYPEFPSKTFWLLMQKGILILLEISSPLDTWSPLSWNALFLVSEFSHSSHFFFLCSAGSSAFPCHLIVVLYFYSKQSPPQIVLVFIHTHISVPYPMLLLSPKQVPLAQN